MHKSRKEDKEQRGENSIMEGCDCGWVTGIIQSGHGHHRLPLLTILFIALRRMCESLTSASGRWVHECRWD